MDSDVPEPLRHFLAQLDELRSASIPDMDRVGRLLTELAADEEYFGPLITEMPSESPRGEVAGQARTGSPAGAIPPATGGDGLHPFPPLLGGHCPGPRRGDPSAVGRSSP